jgi:hypothetical protein
VNHRATRARCLRCVDSPSARPAGHRPNGLPRCR